MLRRLGPRASILPVIVVAVALAVGWWTTDRVGAGTRAPLASALDALPAATVVAGFTDWSAIRHDLGPGETSASVRAALSDDAALRDLTTRSVLGQVVDEMHEGYGWSAADVEWESYGQSADGAVLVARLSGSVSFAEVERRLRAIGYTRRGDVWTLGQDGRRTVGPELAATLGTIALVQRERLVVATSRATYVPDVLATIDGERPSLLTRRAVVDLAEGLTGSDTVLVQAGEEGCRASSVGDADAEVKAQALAAIERAGALRTPTFTARGLVDGERRQDIRFALAFGSPAEAASQVRVRERLATGPFIGRSGRLEDSLDLVSAGARGSVATVRFSLDPDRGAYMSGEGPLLFASCPD